MRSTRVSRKRLEVVVDVDGEEGNGETREAAAPTSMFMGKAGRQVGGRRTADSGQRSTSHARWAMAIGVGKQAKALP